jgi:hypothetical protein
VLADYAAQLPLTIRQIFYRLVGADGYEKTEQAYKRLGELLNKARRARLIDMDAIRDDGFTSQLTTFFANAEAFINNAIAWAEELRLDRQKGQARRLVVWCEASGMVPQLARIADPYGIEVCSSGGFDSLTDKHRIGRLWAGRQAVTVLHLGDHDPSGVHVFSSLAEDIEEFAADYGGDVEFVRVAVTPEQARQYNLPSAPPKATDRRSFDGDETWQCEALDPRTLAAILQAAIDERFDRDLYCQVLEEERDTARRAYPAAQPRLMSRRAGGAARKASETWAFSARCRRRPVTGRGGVSRRPFDRRKIRTLRCDQWQAGENGMRSESATTITRARQRDLPPPMSPPELRAREGDIQAVS